MYRRGYRSLIELLLLLVPLLSVAALPALSFSPLSDEARYNFATIQATKRILVPIGEQGHGSIYFYNVDGNRITHVSLTLSRVPEGWGVSVEPPERPVRVDLNGHVLEVTENLHVEPSPVLQGEPEEVPEGSVTVAVPNRGYTIGKVAQVVVQAPDGAGVGSSVDIKVSAEASWLGQTGAADIRQTRDFEFSAEVAGPSTSPTETVLEDTQASAAGSESKGDSAQGGLLDVLDRWLPAIVAAVIVGLGVAIIPVLVGRRRRER